MENSILTTGEGSNNPAGNMVKFNKDLNGTAPFIKQKEAILHKHIEDLATTNRTWLSRIALPKEDKQLLQVYGEQRKEAAMISLSAQNKSLSAIASGHVAYVTEMVNTIVQVGRAGFKAGADVLFIEYKTNRAKKIEEKAVEFYDMLEAKFADAEKRSPMFQQDRLDEIKIDMANWKSDYEKLLNNFSSVLNQSA
jgi:hypothetical protein